MVFAAWLFYPSLFTILLFPPRAYTSLRPTRLDSGGSRLTPAGGVGRGGRVLRTIGVLDYRHVARKSRRAAPVAEFLRPAGAASVAAVLPCCARAIRGPRRGLRLRCPSPGIPPDDRRTRRLPDPHVELLACGARGRPVRCDADCGLVARDRGAVLPALAGGRVDARAAAGTVDLRAGGHHMPDPTGPDRIPVRPVRGILDDPVLSARSRRRRERR